MSSWVNVFSQSRANNGIYHGERLPEQIWRWPSGTWFQARVRYLRGRRVLSPAALTASRGR